MSNDLDGATVPTTKMNQVWEWLTFAGLLLSVLHLMALWYRWLRPDPQFLEFTTGILELLAIASFLGYQTEGGKRLALKLDDSLGLGRWLKKPSRLCLLVWCILALLAALLYIASPLAARLYRQLGVDAHENGEYSRAISHFKQALSLAPGNARTHYNLANAYEALYDYDKAIAEYQASIELDDSFWPAYNNLGRLYIVARDDPEAALATLISGERRVEDLLSKAVMAKNIGWAYLERGLPGAALTSLDAALESLESLQAEGQSVELYLAETYQLLARTYMITGDAPAARQAWQDSLGYALAVSESFTCTDQGSRLPLDCLTAIQWAAEAREMLAGLR